MTSSFDGYNHIVRLERGERLGETLQQFLDGSDLVGASVSGVGAAEQIILGFYDLEVKEYRWKTLDEPYEITSLLGTIAQDEQGKLGFHLHGTFSGRDYQVVGGHVKDFVVGGTCELFVHRTYQPLNRRYDERTGLNLLDL